MTLLTQNQRLGRRASGATFKNRAAIFFMFIKKHLLLSESLGNKELSV